MKKITKYMALFLTFLTLNTTVLPTVTTVYANQSSKSITNKSFTKKIQIDEKQLAAEIIKDIQKDMSQKFNPSFSSPAYQERGAAGLMATLIAKYGIVYVKKQLPKIIYKHIAKYIGKKVSQQTFIRVFGNIVDWASGATFEQALARGLQQLGVSRGMAHTVSSVVVTVAWWFV